MIIFEQLRISDDGQRMYINAHVNGAEYFANKYIAKLVIKTADQVSETTPELSDGDCVYEKTYDEGTREINEVLSPALLNSNFTDTHTLSNALFFVYIICDNTTSLVGCPPCRLDELTTLGVTFDENLLYQRVMGYTKSLADSCDIPVGFTDFILLWNAFKAAIETEHYIPAVKFYNMLFDSTSQAVDYKPCGCHG